jgi:hypothetical protein
VTVDWDPSSWETEKYFESDIWDNNALEPIVEKQTVANCYGELKIEFTRALEIDVAGL